MSTPPTTTPRRSILRTPTHVRKQAVRFQFDLTVLNLHGLAVGVHCIKWTRGAKVVYTTPILTETKDSTTSVQQKITLLCTLYRAKSSATPSSSEYVQKDSKISLVSLKEGKKNQHTIAKIHFNIAQYAGVPSTETFVTYSLNDKISVDVQIASSYLRLCRTVGSTMGSSVGSRPSAFSCSSDELNDNEPQIALLQPSPSASASASAFLSSPTSEPRKSPLPFSSPKNGCGASIPISPETPGPSKSTAFSKTGPSSLAGSPPLTKNLSLSNDAITCANLTDQCRKLVPETIQDLSSKPLPSSKLTPPSKLVHLSKSVAPPGSASPPKPTSPSKLDTPSKSSPLSKSVPQSSPVSWKKSESERLPRFKLFRKSEKGASNSAPEPISPKLATKETRSKKALFFKRLGTKEKSVSATPGVSSPQPTSSVSPDLLKDESEKKCVTAQSPTSTAFENARSFFEANSKTCPNPLANTSPLPTTPQARNLKLVTKLSSEDSLRPNHQSKDEDQEVSKENSKSKGSCVPTTSPQVEAENISLKEELVASWQEHQKNVELVRISQASSLRLQKLLSDLEKEKEDMRKENALLQNNLNCTREENALLHNDLKTMPEKNALLEKELKKIQEENALLQKGSIAEKNELSQKRLKGMSEENSSLQKELKAMREDNSLLQNQLMGLSEDNVLRQEKLKCPSKDNALLQEKLKCMSEDNALLQKKLEGMSEDNALLQNNLNGMSEDNSILQEKVNSKSEEYALLQKEITDMREAVLQEESKSVLKENELLQKEFDLKSADNVKLQKELARTTSELSGVSAATAELCEQYKQRVELHKTETEALENSKRKIEAELKEAYARLRNKKSENDSTVCDAVQSSKELLEESHKKHIQAVHEGYREELEKVSIRDQDCVKTILELKGMVDSLNQQVAQEREHVPDDSRERELVEKEAKAQAALAEAKKSEQACRKEAEENKRRMLFLESKLKKVSISKGILAMELEIEKAESKARESEKDDIIKALEKRVSRYVNQMERTYLKYESSQDLGAGESSGSSFRGSESDGVESLKPDNECHVERVSCRAGNFVSSSKIRQLDMFEKITDLRVLEMLVEAKTQLAGSEQERLRLEDIIQRGVKGNRFDERNINVRRTTSRSRTQDDRRNLGSFFGSLFSGDGGYDQRRRSLRKQSRNGDGIEYGETFQYCRMGASNAIFEY